MFTILPIEAPSSVKNPILRERAFLAQGGRVKAFVAKEDEEEAGYLCYEDWSDEASAFVYEIFVLPAFRKKGLGSALLSHAENLALHLNCAHIRLKPYALADDPDVEQLKQWYKSHGFGDIAGDSEHLEKRLPAQSAALYIESGDPPA